MKFAVVCLTIFISLVCVQCALGDEQEEELPQWPSAEELKTLSANKDLKYLKEIRPLLTKLGNDIYRAVQNVQNSESPPN